MSDLSLLGIFAHPDDEQLMGGVFARAAAEGIRTGLVCATRGEHGEISDPALATPETLGVVRERELRAACAVLGIKYLYFLDYIDSGWFDRPENNAPGSFNMADDDEATGRIVRKIREFKPTVIVSFDPTGGYGHLDHVKISRLSLRAFSEAADPDRYREAGPAWRTERIYWTSFARSLATRFAELLNGSGMEEMIAQSSFSVIDFTKMGLTDEQITHVIDVAQWLPLKERSVASHRTQMDPNSPFNHLPPELNRQLRAVETYALAAGTLLPGSPEDRNDLFAGLRE